MLNNLFKDTAIYGGADLITKILLFFTFPIIAAALSPLAFGTLELIITTTTLIGIIMNCGLNNAVQRYYWDREVADVHRPVIVSSGLAMLTLFGVIAIIVGFVLLPVLLHIIVEEQLPITWVALVSGLLLLVLSQILSYILDVTRLQFAVIKFVTISFASRLVGVLLGLLTVVWLGWGVDGLLAVQALTAVLILPFAAWMVRQDISIKISKDWIKKLVHLGYPFIFAGIAYWVFGFMDRWMLAAMSSVEEVGIYSIAFRLSAIVLLFSTAFGQAWSPYAVKLRTDMPDQYRSIYADILTILLFVMLIVGGAVALFSGELVGLIMPQEYGDSALPLAVLCFGIVLQSTQQVTAIGISLEKRTSIIARLAWMSAFINLGLNYILIPRFGGLGAAWATTVSYLFLTTSYLYYTQALHTLPINWKTLLLMIFLGAGLILVAINKMSLVIRWDIVSVKLALALICILIVWKLLPINRLRLLGNGSQ